MGNRLPKQKWQSILTYCYNNLGDKFRNSENTLEIQIKFLSLPIQTYYSTFKNKQ